MASFEIPFEYLLVAIESTRGTPEAAPTRHLNLKGTIAPRKARYHPSESRGTLAQSYRSVDARKWSEWDGEGPLDIYTLPMILNAIVAGGIDGSGATDASLTTALTGDNNDIVFTAVTGGNTGNSIGVQYIDPDANDSPLNVDVDGRIIKVYLATDADGDITSTADEIKAAIAAHPAANALVETADAAANDGSGVVTEMGATYLSGGAGTEVTTPDGATLSRLWTFTPTMTADDLEALTLWWGDPNIQAFRAAFCMPDELSIDAVASGDDGVTISLSGQGQFPSKVSDPVVPSMLAAPLLMPGKMQVWIDTDTIGTTEITGRVVEAHIVVPSGVSRKWLAAGPTSDLSFTSIGRDLRQPELRIVFELPDMTQYDQYVAGTVLKVRVRLNGSLIEAGFYYYVDFDIYGPFDSTAWGENAGSNRTMELTILGEYDDDAGYDYCFRIQSDREEL